MIEKNIKQNSTVQVEDKVQKIIPESRTKRQRDGEEKRNIE